MKSCIVINQGLKRITSDTDNGRVSFESVVEDDGHVDC